MRHLVFPPLALALERSKAEALRRGAASAGAVTQYWWPVEPLAVGAAVVIGADTTGLTVAEILLLVDAPAPEPEV